MDWMQVVGLALGGVLAVVIREWLWGEKEGSGDSPSEHP